MFYLLFVFSCIINNKKFISNNPYWKKMKNWTVNMYNYRRIHDGGRHPDILTSFIDAPENSESRGFPKLFPNRGGVEVPSPCNYDISKASIRSVCIKVLCWNALVSPAYRDRPVHNYCLSSIMFSFLFLSHSLCVTACLVCRHPVTCPICIWSILLIVLDRTWYIFEWPCDHVSHVCLLENTPRSFTSLPKYVRYRRNVQFGLRLTEKKKQRDRTNLLGRKIKWP